ncbi:DNase I-like protein [Chiua virens]|nr:DNase I-like protein [Chiua virens]
MANIDQDHALKSLLRSSEHLQCSLDVEPPQDRTDTDAPLARRLIAVVTHHSHLQHTELGSLLVCTVSETNSAPKVFDALPITEYLVLAVAQTDPLASHAAKADPSKTRSAWLLTIRRDTQDATPLEFTIRNRDTQELQNFIAQCRRLKQNATSTHPISTDFTWIEAYLLDPSSRRLDLRLRKQPVHTRLSPAIAGLPGDDSSDITIVRRDWIEKVAIREASSDSVKRLKIRLGTFNVNGKAPSQDLYPWLRSSEAQNQTKTGWISPLKLSLFEVPSESLFQELRKGNPSTSTLGVQAFGDPDILVLGFQELDLSTEALLYASSTLKEDEWLTSILAGLGEKRVLYDKLISRQLVGMLLIVIVKKALVPCFTDVRSCDVGSGIMGFMGNKGATAIRLEFTPNPSSDPQITGYRPTILTFVNAHLAASDEMVERRNYDFQQLSGSLTFHPNGHNGSYPSTSFLRDTYSIYHSDVLFWMVHLNYRLDLPDVDVRKLLFSHQSSIDCTQTLLLYDQLRAAIRANKAFSGFTELQITHNPTYRLALGVAKDKLGYDTKRKPAWTDRILHMTGPDVTMAQVAYRSHPEITMSDHQPVSADFDISVALVDQSQYENSVLALRRELAGFEHSEHRPKIKIQPLAIDFGTVKYKEVIRREAVLQNEGDIPCVFRFVGTGTVPESISPSWLRIEPMVGLMRPREKTTIVLSAYVDDDSAAKLNLGSPKLDSTLIVHTALGKDDFVAVSGNYQYTCFANTLERLTRLVGPIRKFASPEALMPADQAINAPREIMRLINWMMTHVSATDALFAHSVLPQPLARLCHVIRECLDTGDEFPFEFPPEGDGRSGGDPPRNTVVAAFASTLVALLDSLIEPVVPARLHARCLQVKDKDEAFEDARRVSAREYQL